MGDHSRLSRGVPIRSLEGCSIGGIHFHTENVLEVFGGLFGGEESVVGFLQGGGKESSDLLETVLEELATESKLP
jgi:hypothetical protein